MKLEWCCITKSPLKGKIPKRPCTSVHDLPGFYPSVEPRYARPKTLGPDAPFEGSRNPSFPFGTILAASYCQARPESSSNCVCCYNIICPLCVAHGDYLYINQMLPIPKSAYPGADPRGLATQDKSYQLKCWKPVIHTLSYYCRTMEIMPASRGSSRC